MALPGVPFRIRKRGGSVSLSTLCIKTCWKIYSLKYKKEDMFLFTWTLGRGQGKTTHCQGWSWPINQSFTEISLKTWLPNIPREAVPMKSRKCSLLGGKNWLGHDQEDVCRPVVWECGGLQVWLVQKREAASHNCLYDIALSSLGSKCCCCHSRLCWNPNITEWSLRHP